MSAKEEFSDSSYTFDYAPSKDKMFYVLVTYVTAMVVGIVYTIWRLKGYNRPELSFKQILEREERKARLKEQKQKGEKIAGHEKRQESLRQRNIEIRNTDKDEIPYDDEFDEEDSDFSGEPSDISQEEGSSEEEQRLLEEEIKKQKGKVGAKKLKKLQEKVERRQIAKEMEMERQERKQRQQQEELARQQKEEKEREIQKKKEEEERIAKEKKEQEEHELYLELKKEFELNEEGQTEVEDEASMTNKLEEFINYLKEKKVVLLEDLASHFGLRTQAAIDRVQELLHNETITGVIDDRGKFIYISHEELEEVANFVKRRGRVAISEIAAASNKLINIAP